MSQEQIPYKIYLSEDELPRYWYNVRADMKNKPAPLLNSKTLKPMTEDELSEVFCRELARQELDDTTAVLKRRSALPRIYIINLKETTRAEATSSTPQ